MDIERLNELKLAVGVVFSALVRYCRKSKRPLFPDNIG